MDVAAAVDEIQAELNSAEMVDILTLEDVPEPELVEAPLETLRKESSLKEPDFNAKLDYLGGTLDIHGFLAWDSSPNDPYVLSESTDDNRVLVIINMSHPHLTEVIGSKGLVNYFRHCTYDAIAEWKARRRTAAPDSDTIKLLKDGLLRIPFQIEMRNNAEED